MAPMIRGITPSARMRCRGAAGGMGKKRGRSIPARKHAKVNSSNHGISPVTGFLLLLGALIIFPENAPLAMEVDPIVGGVTAVVTGGAEADQHGGLSDAQKALRNEQSHSSDAGKEGWTGGPNNVWQPGSKERVVKRKSFEGQIGERFGIPRTKRTTDSIVT